MGEVFLAEDERLRRKIALKVLPDSLAQDTDRLRRFEQEAFAASALNHPNILTIFEFGKDGATHFLASEFIEGETLRDRMQRGPLSLSETLEIAVQTAQALAAAHEANIIHRDIKPENVMLRKDGIVKVLDFGLAKLTGMRNADWGLGAEENATTLVQSPADIPQSPIRIPQSTLPGTVMGTVAYMSPEQARGNPVDARTDLFSLGVMLYEMLARRQPFTGETINHVIVAILEKEPPPLTGVPAELTRILAQALAKQADERYGSAQAMLADLKKLQTRLLVEAENKRNSADDAPVEAQTMMLPQTTSAAPAALATAAASAQPTSPNYPKPQKWWLAAGLSLLLAVGGFFGYKWLTPKQIESIAVMPFVNESGNEDVEYLSDGMTETLIKSLSNLPNLNVKPRSSVFRYKGKDTDMKTIGKELNVEAILNGRVIQRGEQLTLSLELIDVQNDKVLWTESYQRKQSDIVTLQSEIAKDVSTNLKAKLSGTDQTKITKITTSNPEAYQLYLKGRYQWNKRTGESFKQAVEFFNQAVEKDPNYALAYSGLAETYVLFPNYSLTLPIDSMPKAKAAALRAIELDDSLAETHTALGIYYSNFAWNLVAAEKEFRRAIELNPNYAVAHQQFGIECLSATGRFDEAVAESKRAVELDPVSPIISADFGNVLFRARRFDEAIVQLNRALELDPNFWVTRWYLGSVFDAKGQFAEAVAEYKKALALNDNPFVKALLISSLAKLGKRDEAVKLFAELQLDATRRVVTSASLALVYNAVGERDKAFALLDKEISNRTSRPRYFAITAIWDDFRNDPRFAELVKRVEMSKMD